jgi:transcriptional regulator with XRE-family HTH domain
VDELPIGRRVAYWRGRRRMSQQVFADRLGKSKSWVDKVERGVRRLDKFSVIHDIADVLQMDAQLLLGPELGPEAERRGGHGVSAADIAEIRAALERYDQVRVLFDAPPDPPDLTEVRKAIKHAWLTYQHAKGVSLVRTLPDLLRQAQAADAAYQGGDGGAESAHLLGQAYQITSSTLRNLGQCELAWLAADRAVTVAQRSGDELLAGMATFRVSLALMALDRARPALELSLSVANRLAPPDGCDTGPKRHSVYGMLLLQGAMAAAKIGDSATTEDLLRAAEEAAKQLGADYNHYWSCFGPTNVLLHRVAAKVELGEGRYAVATHEQIGADGFAALVPERRVHYLLDLARGWAQVGDVNRAGEMLVAGDRLAPNELRYRPVVRDIIGEVLRQSNGHPPAAVTELAAQVGVAA